MALDNTGEIGMGRIRWDPVGLVNHVVFQPKFCESLIRT